MSIIVNSTTPTRRATTLVKIVGTGTLLVVAALVLRVAVIDFSRGSYVFGALEALCVLYSLHWAARFARGAAGTLLVAALAARQERQ